MNRNITGVLHNQLVCDVCKINFSSEADFALHEFSKKHCDNLLKIARHKPVRSKVKVKNERAQVDKEPAKVTNVTQPGSFAKYGYFVPGEIYTNPLATKEYNTEYDLYLQKFAESSFKEKATSSATVSDQNNLSTAQTNITSFNKKKRKKIKTCQICNVTLGTMPEYEAHMKSSQHLWKLKISGMGVSAHFVKASSDLHTTDFTEDPKTGDITQDNTSTDSNIICKESNTPEVFPSLYCDVCELLLNSPQQYNAHIKGKSHSELSQRKAELKAKKEKLQTPTPNQLYCYSCKISLNNLNQYNEHKNGKRHKIRCKQLMREGIAIPPEERISGWVFPKPNNDKPVIYPELYEKFVLKGKNTKSCTDMSKLNVEGVNEDTAHESGFKSTASDVEKYYCDTGDSEFDSVEKYECRITRLTHPQNTSALPGNYNTVINNSSESNVTFTNVSTTFQTSGQLQNTESKEQKVVANPEEELVLECNIEPNGQAKKGLINTDTNLQLPAESASSMASIEMPMNNNCDEADFESRNCDDTYITLIRSDEFLKCNICTLNFNLQSEFDSHLNTEEHWKNILDLKVAGRSESCILNIILVDRQAVKPDKLGKSSCSVCNVSAENMVEYKQHLKSIVHKYTQRDYKNKRTLELKQIVSANEQGLYFCNFCEDGWSSLLEFIQHLHLAKHKSKHRAEKIKKILARRKSFILKKQKILERKNYKIQQLKTKKNPGIRTKICGTATDLQTGAKAQIPNLEQLEPKIDSAKNVHLGVCDKPNDNQLISDIKNQTVSKIKKQGKPRKTFTAFKHKNNNLNRVSPKNIPPLITSQYTSTALQPLSFPLPLLHQKPIRPTSLMSTRVWNPYSNPYQFRNGFFCNRPSLIHNYQRPPLYQQPFWPRNSNSYR